MRNALSLLVGVALVLAPAGAAWARGADGDFEVRESSHFILHQDVDIDQSGGFHGSRRFEQQVLETLEHAYESADRLLGLRPDRKMHVVVYDPGIFDRTFAGMFKFRIAGLYEGVVRIRGDTALTARLQQVLHHEHIHACLDRAAPSYVFPAWTNEGAAEWFEARALGKRGLSAGEWNALRSWAGQGALLSLAQLSAPSFAGFQGGAAQIAYLQSYALIEFLGRNWSERHLSRFYAELIRKRDVDRALERTFSIDSRDLERRFFAQFR